MPAMRVHPRVGRTAFTIVCVAIVGLIVAGGAAGQSKPEEPAPPADGKAPWQRLLTGDDAKRAAEWQQKFGELCQAGKYAEAREVARQILALRQRVQGVDHWQTADARRTMDDLKRLERLTVAERDQLREGTALLQRWVQLYQAGKFQEALPLARQVAAIHRKVVGEDDTETAGMYTFVAINLDALGQYAEAEPLFRQALAVYRKVQGDEHPNTPTSYNNLANNLDGQGKHAEAEPLLRRALALRRRVQGDEHRDSATCYNNLAANLYDQGKYAEAEVLVRRTLALRRKLLGEEDPDTAQSYENVAATLDAQGKYAAADPFCRHALALCRKEKGEEHPDTAACYNRLAIMLDHQGKYTEAEPLLRRALALRRRLLGEEHPDTANSYYHVARCLHAQGQYAEAEVMWRAAAKSYEAARLRISFGGLERAAFAAEHSPLPGLATCLARAGKATEAWHSWEANLARGLFDDLSARLARPLSDKERQRQHELIGQLQFLDKQIAALIESGDQTDAQRQELEKLKQQRDAGLTAFTQFEAELAKTHGPAAGQVYELAHVQAHLPADAALLSWVDTQGEPKAADANGEHWACVVRQRGEPIWVRLRGSGPHGAWTRDDDALPGQVRELLMAPPSDAAVQWRERTGRLYTQRLAPLAKYLGATADLPAVRHLILLPSPWLAGVPVEALVEARMDQQPAYTISYAPSGTLFAWLQEQKRQRAHKAKKPDPPRLLALGDPVFAPAEKPDKAPREEQAFHELMQRTRGPGFARLPGSRREVEAIARLFERADKLLGSQASEQQLEQWAAAGRLQEYTYLHLATHGVLDPNMAMHSALILSQDRLPDPWEQVLAGKRAYDGRLTAAQILRTWKLDADLVTLSACQTGLGHYQGGEGYVGFAQALFVAGSRSLVLSQWSVDDNATALLMTRFYQNLLGKRKDLKGPLAKAEALHEAKAWLRGLSADQVEQRLDELSRGVPRPRPPAPVPAAVHPYGHPYYWAAFILVGDPH
jgi:CHAT domain-containing protein